MGWNDGDVKEWSLTGLKLSPIYDSVRLFLNAVKERQLVAGNGIIGGLDDIEKLEPYSPILEKIDRLVVGQWGCDDKDNNGDQYVSPWINHTDNGGDWHKQDSIPVWTKEAILAAIEQEEYIRLQYISNIAIPGFPLIEVPLFRLNQIMANWALQIYKMLNLFRWNFGTVTFNNTFFGNFSTKKSGGTSYNDAVNNWPANFTDGVLLNLFSSSNAVISYDSNTVDPWRLERRYSIDDLQKYQTRTNDIKHDCDLYIYVRIPPGSINNNVEFSTHGDDVEENKYAKAVTYTGQKLTFRNWSMVDGDLVRGDTPFDRPNDTEKGWTNRGSEAKPVLRWDVTDGFEYVTEL